MTTKEIGEMMTVPDLQLWLGVGRSKSYELVRTGQIKSYRVGRLIRVRRQDALDWLEANRHHTVNNPAEGKDQGDHHADE